MKKVLPFLLMGGLLCSTGAQAIGFRLSGEVPFHTVQRVCSLTGQLAENISLSRHQGGATILEIQESIGTEYAELYAGIIREVFSGPVDFENAGTLAQIAKLKAEANCFSYHAPFVKF